LQLAPREMNVSASVRRAGRHEAAALAQLINRAYQVEDFFVDGARTSADEVVGLADRGFFLVLDRHEGGLAAAVHVSCDGRCGALTMLSVAPELQGRGLGRRLVAVAEALCVALGCVEVGLRLVNLRDELRPWYRRMGYHEVGTAPYDHRLAKRPCHFLRLRKPLVS